MYAYWVWTARDRQHFDREKPRWEEAYGYGSSWVAYWHDQHLESGRMCLPRTTLQNLCVVESSIFLPVRTPAAFVALHESALWLNLVQKSFF